MKNSQDLWAVAFLLLFLGLILAPMLGLVELK